MDFKISTAAQPNKEISFTLTIKCIMSSRCPFERFPRLVILISHKKTRHLNSHDTRPIISTLEGPLHSLQTNLECKEESSFSYENLHPMQLTYTGLSKKVPAKFSDSCSVRADGLCIGYLGQWAERGRKNSNMQEIFRTTL